MKSSALAIPLSFFLLLSPARGQHSAPEPIPSGADYIAYAEKLIESTRREKPDIASRADELYKRLPAIVDQVITMSLFEADGDGWRHEPSKGQVRRLVCRSGNPYALPAKDRSGRLDVTEPPDLGALLTKINRTDRSA